MDPLGQSVGADQPLFALRFSALQGGAWLHEVLGLKPKALAAEAYTVDHRTGDLQLVFTEPQTTGVQDPSTENAGLQLLQNRPNPFSERTTIGFVLPEACDAQLRILDVTGRELLRINKTYPAGYHEETIRLKDIRATGILYYELITPQGRLSRKMTAVGP